MKKLVLQTAALLFCLWTGSLAQTISTFPYNEGFEDNEFNFPAGWTQDYVVNSDSWQVVSVAHWPGNSHSGSRIASLFSEVEGSRTILSTPPMDLSGLNSPMLSFWHQQLRLGLTNNVLRVYYKTSADGEWILLKEYLDYENNWTERLVALPNRSADYYIGFEGHIGFVHLGGGGFDFGYAVQIDDLTVNDMPDSPIIAGTEALAFDNVSNNLPWSYVKQYTIQNRGGHELYVSSMVSATAGITVSDIPVSIEPMETATVTVTFNTFGLPHGAYSGNFVLACNDPATPQFTVDVTASLQASEIGSPLDETFDENMPAGWLCQQFTRQTSGGVNNTPHMRARLRGQGEAARGTLQTCYVEMGNNPAVAFKYKSTSFATGNPATAGSLEYSVFISKDNGISAKEVLFVPEGSHVPSADYVTVSVPADSLSAYANELCLVQITFWSIDADIFVNVDDVTAGSVLDNDLTAVSITGNRMPTAGMPDNYTALIKNLGTGTQNSYSVKLMMQGESGDVEIGSLNGVSIGKNETKQMVFSWTPSAAGSASIYAKVILEGDEKPLNNQTGMLAVTVQPAGIKNIAIGEQTAASVIPYHFLRRKSLSQTLYYPHELGINGGEITSVTYKANIVSTGSTLQNIPIQVWVGETDMASLQNDWVPLSDMTEVFDGTMSFPAGTQDVVVTFNEPYEYQGGGLVVYSYRKDTGVNGNAGDLFIGTPFPDSYRSRIYSTDSETIVLDPANPRFGFEQHSIPNTVLSFNLDGMYLLSGVAGNGTEPLEGVKIQIAGTSLHTFTDVAGNYSFILKPGNYSLVATIDGYAAQTVPVVIDSEAVIKDIELSSFAVYTVSGTVTDALTGEGIEGAKVKLAGTKNYEAVTGAGGIYEIAGVQGGSEFEYSVNVSAITYEDAADTITVTENETVYNYSMNRVPYPVIGVTATENSTGTEVAVTWAKPETVLEYGYDNGTVHGQLSMNTLAPQAVFGTLHSKAATLRSMSWYLTDAFGNTETTVNLYVFALNADGSPSSTVIYSESDIPSTTEEWNMYEFAQAVEAPDGFLVAVGNSEHATVPLAMGTSMPDSDHPLIAQTQFYTANYESTPFSVVESLYEIHMMIRAYGTPLDDSEQTPAPQHTIAPAAKRTFNTAAPVEDNVIRFTARAPKVTVEPVYATRGYDTPNPNDYTVYRLLHGTAQSEWAVVAGNVTSLTVTDTGWETAPQGVYQYAVVSNYPNNSSVPELSNLLPKNMTAKFIVNLTTDSGDPVNGASLTLTNLNDDFEYFSRANNGTVTFPEVWKGTYSIFIKLEGHEKYYDTGIVIDADRSYPAQLKEIVIAPYGLEVETNGNSAVFTWNNYNGFFDDMESYTSFTIDNIGSYTQVDVDGSGTYGGLEGYDWQNMFYTGSFMVFNPSATTPPLVDEYPETAPYSGSTYLACFSAVPPALGGNGPNNDWLILPQQNIVNGIQLRFMAKTPFPYQWYGAERFRVAISETGMDIADFTVISEGDYEEAVFEEWTEHVYDLSDYAGQDIYIAINCVSNDAAFLMIDDISVDVESRRKLINYSVSIDDSETVTTQNTQYEFKNLLNGTHTAKVKAVYSSSESSTETVNFEITGSSIGSSRTDDIQLYPNPFTDEIRISNPLAVTGIVITNAAAQTIKTLRAVPANGAIETGNLAGGVYFVTIESATGEKTVYKMVKK